MVTTCLEWNVGTDRFVRKNIIFMVDGTLQKRWLLVGPVSDAFTFPELYVSDT